MSELWHLERGSMVAVTFNPRDWGNRRLCISGVSNGRESRSAVGLLRRGSAGCATWMTRTPFRRRGHSFLREAARAHTGSAELSAAILRARRQAAVTGARSPQPQTRFRLKHRCPRARELTFTKLSASGKPGSTISASGLVAPVAGAD